ncbi:MAG: ElyC/SanA/YdcF family protein, partial [Deltaproteobacteria bacterium]
VELIAGRPIIVQARRFTDFKWNTFFTGIPGHGNLHGIYYLTADPEEGGLGFNLIIGGKAHKDDWLCQKWANELKGYNRDPKLKGRFIFLAWTTENSQIIIRGSKASLQTTIPPYEAAGMKDKKDGICYNIVVSSYTGGPVQQVTNVLHHGTNGNGYIYEPYSQLELQRALEDLSARFYAYIYTKRGITVEQVESMPNKNWAGLVTKYMKEEPEGILKIMHNAGRMLPVVDSRTAAMKYAYVYMKMLGMQMDYSRYSKVLADILKEFGERLPEVKSSSSPLTGAVIKSGYATEGQIFTRPEDPMGLRIVNKEKGATAEKYLRKPVGTANPFGMRPKQEVLHVLQGQIECKFYTEQNEFVGQAVLAKGDTVLFTEGRQISFLEDSVLLEVTQGPSPETEESDKIVLPQTKDEIAVGKPISATDATSTAFKKNGRTIGVIVRSNHIPEKTQRFTAMQDPISFNALARKAGDKGTRLYHTSVAGENPFGSRPRQEVLFILKGRAKAYFYTTENKIVGVDILNAGDTVLFTEGHMVEFLEDTVFVEAKQGPYPETKDKDGIILKERAEFFKSISPAQIKTFVQSVFDFMSKRDSLASADIMMVFGNYDMQIAVEAAKLAGLAERIITTGFKGKFTQHFTEPEAVLFKRVLVENGVPEDKIIAEDKSTNTKENLDNSFAILDDLGIKHDTAILVAHPLHQFRAQATLRRYYPAVRFMNHAAYLLDVDKMSIAELRWILQYGLRDIRKIRENSDRDWIRLSEEELIGLKEIEDFLGAVTKENIAAKTEELLEGISAAPSYPASSPVTDQARPLPGQHMPSGRAVRKSIESVGWQGANTKAI